MKNELLGLVVATKDGMPLFKLFYDKYIMKQADLTLTTNFVAALINMSTIVAKNGLISDIGFHANRLYIDQSQKLVYLVFFNESSLGSITLEKSRMIMKGTISSVKSFIEVLISEEFPNEISIIDIYHLKRVLAAVSSEIDDELQQSFKEIYSIAQEILSYITFSDSFDEGQGLIDSSPPQSIFYALNQLNLTKQHL